MFSYLTVSTVTSSWAGAAIPALAQNVTGMPYSSLQLLMRVCSGLAGPVPHPIPTLVDTGKVAPGVVVGRRVFWKQG